MAESSSNVLDIEGQPVPAGPEPTPAPVTAEPKVDRFRPSVAPSTNRRPSTQPRTTSMNGPLYMQTSNNKVLIRRVKKKGDGPMKSVARWLLDNQTGFSFNLIALVFLAHVFLPKARPHTLKFFTLSYHNPDTGRYGIGGADYYFILFCTVLYTGLRAACMENVLAPLARHWGVSKTKDITRFSEQAWLLVYYIVFWSLGLYLYQQSPYWLNLKELWTGWPDRELDGLMKGYMLAQWAFWLQQVFVIHIEERRKDHWQMLSHHFITIALISTSYCYHFTRVGNLILVLMDIVDLFFPLAKCLKYTGYSTLCDIMFGLFMVSWFVARHVFYLMTCYSIFKDAPTIITMGCYRGRGADLTGPLPSPEAWSVYLEPFKNPEGTVCFTDTVLAGFLGSLLCLQVITIFWFFMIVRVAIRVLKGGSADDPRSDEEAEEDEEEEFEYEEAQPLEEEVGVEALDLKGWERRTGVKRAASSSGVSLPGHSDRKELLGRIGCEKQVD
ncbi:longevity assurance proteins LAG1/LAC1 [Xylariomycetidae sp. FL0641]|nr:longevity assurance proteins LAG1/LAC1 [Xylariomycetidae sp. FL0641]